MAAPAGNEFWKQRSSHGRKPIFASAEQLETACDEYFTWVEANPLYEAQAFAYQGTVTVHELSKMRAMTLAGLCIFLDIDRATWADYAAREDFFLVTTRVDDIIRTQKFAGAAAGLLNANIIARDLGLADKSEFTGKDGGPIATDNAHHGSLALSDTAAFIADALGISAKPTSGEPGED
jgi:hypothetical protein